MTTRTRSTPATLRSRHASARLFTALVAAGLASSSGYAQTTFIKANNSTALNLAGSYTPANTAVPGINDTIQFDSTFSTAGGPAIGGNLSVFGIIQTDLVGKDVSINTTANSTLTIGAGGVSQLSATKNLFLTATTALSADQAWTVTKQITVGSNGFSLNSKTLTTSGSGTLGISGQTGIQLAFDLSTATLGNGTVTIGGTGTSSGTTATFGTANTFDALSVTGGRVFGSTLGNYTVASSFGDGGSSSTITLGNNGSNGVLEYTGADASSNRTFTRDGRSVASGIDVTNAGTTLTISGNLLAHQQQNNVLTNGWAFGGAGNLVLSGVISDGPAGSTGTTVTKNGTGALTLSGLNTFTGGVTLNTGTLNINNAGVVGTKGALGNGGTFTINGGTIDNTSGAALVMANVNPIVLGGDFAFSTAAGTANNNLSLGGPVTLGANRTITTNGAGVLTLSGVIGGAGEAFSLTKAGTGTLKLSGTNTYTGGTNINAGTVAIANAAALGSGIISFGGGTLQYSGITTDLSARLSKAGNQDYKIDTNGQNVKFASALSGTGTSLTKEGSGTLVLVTATNTFDGLVTVNGGTLSTQSSAVLNVNNEVAVASGATLDTIATNLPIAGLSGSGTVTNTSGASKTLTLGGTGTYIFDGAITKVGTSTLNIIKSGTGTQTLAGVNTYSGSTSVTGGKLVIGSTGTINGSSGVSIGGGEFNYINATTALTPTVSFSGTGGTLRGTGTIANAVSVTSGNTLAAGVDALTLGTLSFSGNLTGASGATFSLKINSTSGLSDLMASTGAIALGGATLSLTDLGSATLSTSKTFTLLSGTSVAGTFLGQTEGSVIALGNNSYTLSYLNNAVTLNYTASAVPEPATYAALAGLGILIFAAYRRRKSV